MGAALGPTRPDRLTIWPVEGDSFGIDVRWAGATGNRRATVVARLLEGAGIRGRLSLRAPRRVGAPGRRRSDRTEARSGWAFRCLGRQVTRPTPKVGRASMP